jgi:hypothetical protein
MPRTGTLVGGANVKFPEAKGHSTWHTNQSQAEAPNTAYFVCFCVSFAPIVAFTCSAWKLFFLLQRGPMWPNSQQAQPRGGCSSWAGFGPIALSGCFCVHCSLLVPIGPYSLALCLPRCPARPSGWFHLLGLPGAVRVCAFALVACALPLGFLYVTIVQDTWGLGSSSNPAQKSCADHVER